MIADKIWPNTVHIENSHDEPLCWPYLQLSPWRPSTHTESHFTTCRFLEWEHSGFPSWVLYKMNFSFPSRAGYWLLNKTNPVSLLHLIACINSHLMSSLQRNNKLLKSSPLPVCLVMNLQRKTMSLKVHVSTII